ncbi:hypothetical protein CVT26_007527 [Gymnopilus dilepis]|uniref:Integrase catalytic domain-containing protein n=1 Tax=Gymnopilus dilepis TaxID=231916 RepID=A0A409WWQ0_9AGAR|nr:hypothetical protein CVT26_007527 [Gymnopilus dilepis]
MSEPMEMTSPAPRRIFVTPATEGRPHVTSPVAQPNFSNQTHTDGHFYSIGSSFQLRFRSTSPHSPAVSLPLLPRASDSPINSARTALRPASVHNIVSPSLRQNSFAQSVPMTRPPTVGTTPTVQGPAHAESHSAMNMPFRRTPAPHFRQSSRASTHHISYVSSAHPSPVPFLSGSGIAAPTARAPIPNFENQLFHSSHLQTPFSPQQGHNVLSSNQDVNDGPPQYTSPLASHAHTHIPSNFPTHSSLNTPSQSFSHLSLHSPVTALSQTASSPYVPQIPTASVHAQTHSYVPSRAPSLLSPAILPVASPMLFHAQPPNAPFNQNPPAVASPMIFHAQTPNSLHNPNLPNVNLLSPARNNVLLSPLNIPPFQIPNNALNGVQPLYVSSSTRPSLPSTKEIPKLTGKSDWGPWHTAVVNLITNQQVYNHISDGLDDGAAYDPLFLPTYPPVVHPNSTPQELNAFNDWWAQDGIAAHILLSRLADSVTNSIPAPNQRLGQRRSARDIYTVLRLIYGIGDYNSAMTLENKIRALTCGATSTSSTLSVPDYIASFRLHTNQMSAAGYPLPPRQLLQLFADGLPKGNSYSNLRDSIYISLNEPDNRLLPSLETAFDRARIIDDTIQRLRDRQQLPPRSARTSRQPNNSPNSTTKPTLPSTSRPTCDNCKGAHPTENCFQPGGAKEGKREEVLANKRPKVQAHVAEIPDNAGPSEMHDTEITDLSLHDPIAALSLARPASTESIDVDAYALSSISKLIDVSTPATVQKSIQQLNTALDSACTVHLIKDRQMFWTYNPYEATPVRTANCGIMETLARGEVRARMTIKCDNGKTINVRWRFPDCLHAPMIPFNLLSVGQLNDAGFSCNFGPEQTVITFPSEPRKIGPLSGQCFTATRIHRISFVDLQFIPPMTKPPSIEPISAFPAFPVVDLTPDLWHRRLGHPGQDVTRATLTKDSVDGVKWTGSFERSHCIPCIIGKKPQASFTSNKNRADKICDLIHIDTCGPFPVLTPHKERYYLAMLDDCSNSGNVALLVQKNGAFAAWKSTRAKWENISGNRVIAVRLDGAKELVEGDLGDHFTETGIIVQQTAPYAHQQNGKIERYIRTLSDTAQTLLADAGLPPSFWGYATQTAQYLRNRLPTKTLKGGITPYERLQNKKPDLSQLRVWGCRCYVHQPEEIRGKGAPRRFEATFIGYEEDRLGWLRCHI